MKERIKDGGQSERCASAPNLIKTVYYEKIIIKDISIIRPEASKSGGILFSLSDKKFSSRAEWFGDSFIVTEQELCMCLCILHKLVVDLLVFSLFY